VIDVPFYLRSAIEESFSPDPHLGIADARTVEAVAQFVRWMSAVSKSRRLELANEPWTGKPSARHFEHALSHTEAALVSVETRMVERYLDEETRLPNAAHAGLRLAFGMARHTKEYGR
jgi:hypothetical protein